MARILVIGYSSRYIASAAARCGHEVYSIDAFCDVDLKQCTRQARSIVEYTGKGTQYITDEDVLDLIAEMGIKPEGIVLGSGFENLDLKKLECPVFNNDSRTMASMSDKYQFAEKMQLLGIPHPATRELEKTGELDFPLMIKPKVSGGGVYNLLVFSETELSRAVETLKQQDPTLKTEDLLAQEFIEGIPVSVSFLSAGDRSIAIAANEQLIGTEWLVSSPFAYCGNITPLRSSWIKEMYLICETISNELSLAGSNGVDFILTENGPVVIELNPRFQGSLDCVEMATDIDLFDLHLKTFEDILPFARPKMKRYAIRAVMYAQRPYIVREHIPDRIDQGIADIPPQGTRIDRGDPILSILTKGPRRNKLFEATRKKAALIRDKLNIHGNNIEDSLITEQILKP